jgi:WD40 repeat protein
MKKKILLHITAFFLLSFLPVDHALAGATDFPTENKIIYDATFSKHGKVLFVADGMGIKAFSFDDRNLMREFNNEHTSQIMSLSVSSDSTLIASGDRDGKLVLHNMENGHSLHTFHDHEGIIMSTDISPDSKFLATGSTDNNVVLYDLSKMEVIDIFRVHTDDVLGIKFSPDGKWLVSTGADGKVAVFDMENQKLHRILEDLDFFIRDVDFSNDSQFFITVGDDGRYYTWRISEMGNIRMTRSSRVLNHWITSINYSGAEPVFVAANTRGHIRLFAPVTKLSTNVKVPVNTVLLRPREDNRIEIIAATMGKGIVFIDGRDMRVRGR